MLCKTYDFPFGDKAITGTYDLIASDVPPALLYFPYIHLKKLKRNFRIGLFTVGALVTEYIYKLRK
jgi:hypothetical protein